MTKLHYILDPMCSWCYAFSQTMAEVQPQLPPDIPLRYVMGGLAPDSDAPMAPEMQQYVQQAWRTIAQRTGLPFNFAFWEKCQPRRATYPACRAVIAAGLQGETHIPAMIGAIQTAYYQQARNPSEETTLVALAEEMGLDKARFADELHSPQVEALFMADLNFKNQLGVQGFPTLVLETDNRFYGLTIGYTEPAVILERFDAIMAQATA